MCMPPTRYERARSFDRRKNWDSNDSFARLQLLDMGIESLQACFKASKDFGDKMAQKIEHTVRSLVRKKTEYIDLLKTCAELKVHAQATFSKASEFTDELNKLKAPMGSVTMGSRRFEVGESEKVLLEEKERNHCQASIQLLSKIYDDYVLFPFTKLQECIKEEYTIKMDLEVLRALPAFVNLGETSVSVNRSSLVLDISPKKWWKLIPRALEGVNQGIINTTNLGHADPGPSQ